jgi:hypothetical protein
LTPAHTTRQHPTWLIHRGYAPMLPPATQAPIFESGSLAMLVGHSR